MPWAISAATRRVCSQSKCTTTLAPGDFDSLPAPSRDAARESVPTGEWPPPTADSSGTVAVDGTTDRSALDMRPMARAREVTDVVMRLAEARRSLSFPAEPVESVLRRFGVVEASELRRFGGVEESELRRFGVVEASELRRFRAVESELKRFGAVEESEFRRSGGVEESELEPVEDEESLLSRFSGGELELDDVGGDAPAICGLDDWACSSLLSSKIVEDVESELDRFVCEDVLSSNLWEFVMLLVELLLSIGSSELAV